MNANSRQVAGTHYQVPKGGIGHWDYCIGASVPNLEYNASKYVTRWRKKNGVQDLEKALHIVEKRIESVQQGVGILRSVNRKDGMFNRFIEDNKIVHRDRCIIDLIMHWKRIDQLYEAHAQLKEIIEKFEEENEGEATSAYVNQGGE